MHGAPKVDVFIPKMMTGISRCSANRRRDCPYRLADIGNLLACLTIALSSYVLVCMPKAEARELRCDDANVVVYSPSLADAKSVCDGAADAIGFLGAQGLETSGQIEVLVVDKLADPISSSSFGGYLHSGRRAYLLTSSKVAKRGTVFSLPFDRTLYRSLATHEIAHAIGAVNFRIPNPPIEAEEYIAYVAMFATLPATHRGPLLARFKDEKFETEIQINPLVYILDPFRFGILSYKHFMKSGNGAAFLQQVLTGRALRQFAY